MGKNQSSINQSNEKKIIINDINYINDIYYNKKISFKNLGWSFYMNNFLQILIHIPGFIQKLKKTKIYWRKIIFFITDNMSKENLSKNQTNI